MVNTPRIDENLRSHGLLRNGEEYEVLAYHPDGDALIVRVKANYHILNEDGALEFYHVVDNVLHFVQGYGAGQVVRWSVVGQETADQLEAETQQIVDEVTAQLATTEAAAESSVREFESADLDAEREQIKSQLRAGEFPEGNVIPHHKQLKDIWEGKGDPDADAFGLVTRSHENVPHEDALEDLEDENRAYWPTGADPDELNRWLRERQEREAERLEQLRKEADAVLDDEVLPSLPAHLNPAIPNPENHPGLPLPPYSDNNPVYTTMVGADGTLPILRDREGERVEPPEAVKVYAETHRGGSTSSVEPWLGKATGNA